MSKKLTQRQAAELAIERLIERHNKREDKQVQGDSKE